MIEVKKKEPRNAHSIPPKPDIQSTAANETADEREQAQIIEAGPPRPLLFAFIRVHSRLPTTSILDREWTRINANH
jgi:hypothetical protein